MSPVFVGINMEIPRASEPYSEGPATFLHKVSRVITLRLFQTTQEDEWNSLGYTNEIWLDTEPT